MKTLLIMVSFIVFIAVNVKAQGASCTNSTEVDAGENTGPLGESWFKYIATRDGKIVIESESGNSWAEVYDECEGTVIASTFDNTLLFESTNTSVYYIVWNSIVSDFNWTISEVDIEDGDFCSYPKTAVVGTNSADNSIGDQWFTYTPTANGTLTLSTCSLTSENTYVYIYDECNTSSLAFSNDDCSFQSTLSYDVTANTTYYIKWDNENTSATYNWNLSFVEDQVTHSFSPSVSEIELYPNPASDQLFINAENPVQYVRMLNMQGVVVKEVANPSNTINLNLSKGLYVVEVYFEEGTMNTQKLMVK